MTKNLLSELTQFIGTEHYYKHLLGLNFTDGVKYLADNAGCYWWLDIIASYQSEIRDCPFQIWRIEVSEYNSGVVTMREDDGIKPRVKQEIPYTDFPLKEYEMYCINGVILLKSEY